MERSSENPKKVGLIVAADEPGIIFSSTQVAEDYLEAIDVRDGVYPEAFGPAGEVYAIHETDDQVFIVRIEDAPPDPERTRILVERFLTSYGVQFASNVPLADLVALCEPFVDDGLT